jgi:hypothetical protein
VGDDMDELKDEVETDPFEDFETIDKGTTAHDHTYILDPQQDPNTEMTSIMCTGCNHGCNITSEFTLKAGKIVKV